VALVWGLSGWLAQTHVAGSRYEIKRNIKGVGPWLGAQWRPGGSGWRVTVSGGLQYVRNDNQDPLIIPCQEDCGGPIPDHSRHGADWAGHGGTINARLTLPARRGPRFEFGVVAIRHTLFNQVAWWTRVEVGLRLGGD
jgi:hypothetical protein